MAIRNADGSIILTTQVDTTGLNKGMSTMRTGVNKLSSTFRKIGATIGVALGINAIVQFGKESVKLASDLQEVQNVVDVAFGSMSYKMEQFADTAIETFGLSELAAKQTGSSFMAMAKSMGFAEESASEMALTLTGLSADMASFYNVQQSEARTALSAVYTGETETLKRYGILITEVNLQEFARQKGIYKSINAMTQQEKGMLRYQYVLQATALAQGDFARTSDSWANQTRILSERWNQLKATFGQAFMAIGSIVLPVINAIIAGLQKVAEVALVVAKMIYKAFTGKDLQIGSSATDNQANSFENLGGTISGATDEMENFGDATESAGKKAKKSLASFDDLERLMSDVSESTESAGGGIGDVDFGNGMDFSYTGEGFNDKEVDTWVNGVEEKLQGFVDWYKTNFATSIETNSKTVETAFNGIKDTANIVFSDFQTNIAPKLSSTFNESIVPVLNGFVTEFGKTNETLFTETKKAIDTIYQEGISPTMANFTTIWAESWEDTKKVWDEKGAVMFSEINTAIKSTGDSFQKIWDEVFKPAVDWFNDTVYKTWEEEIRPMLESIQGRLMDLEIEFLKLYNEVLVPFWNFLVDAFGPIFLIVWEDIIANLLNFIETVMGVFNELLGVFQGILQFIRGVFTGEWTTALYGLVNVLSGIVNIAAEIIEGVCNSIIAAVNTLLKSVSWVTEGLFGFEFFGGYQFPKIDIPEIPPLAQGAVIPPNREFLAVLGDQKQGYNIETPLDTMIQAFQTALDSRNGGGNGDTTVVLEIDGREFGRAVIEQGNKENRRIGTRLVIA